MDIKGHSYIIQYKYTKGRVEGVGYKVIVSHNSPLKDEFLLRDILGWIATEEGYGGIVLCSCDPIPSAI